MSKTIHLFGLIVASGLLLSRWASAQVFTTLYNFTAYSGIYNNNTEGYNTNTDGASPISELILSGETLYGTTSGGGYSATGTVFSIKTDGTDFSSLYEFTDLYNGTNADGAYSCASLLLIGDALYGTARYGALFGDGSIFSIRIDGTGFTNIHNFKGDDGSNPQAALIQSGNTLYGTTAYGGAFGAGSVFAINMDGSGFTNLYSFSALSSSQPGTNADGATPVGVLALSGSTLYGTALYGGSIGKGTVFAIGQDGIGFTNLLNFDYGIGANPFDGLLVSSNILYGTTSGGPYAGEVFSLRTDGTGFTNLHNFRGITDGANPVGSLVMVGSSLFSTTPNGPDPEGGTIFKINCDGTGFSTLHVFEYLPLQSILFNDDGANPMAGLIFSGNTFYGTTASAGHDGNGTVFSFSFAPYLAITSCESNVVLTWPTSFEGFDYTGYTLQATTSLVSPVTWTPVLPLPVVVSGLETVTNAISGTRMFYRLIQ